MNEQLQAAAEEEDADDDWGLRKRKPGEPFVACYLVGASCGGVEITKILYWYDGPIMFLAQDAHEVPYFVVQTDDDRDRKTWTHMAITLSPGEADAIRQAPDIETVNDLARAALRAGHPARSVEASWLKDGKLVSETVLALTEAEDMIGDGHLEKPYEERQIPPAAQEETGTSVDGGATPRGAAP